MIFTALKSLWLGPPLTRFKHVTAEQKDFHAPDLMFMVSPPRLCPVGEAVTPKQKWEVDL